MGWEEIRWRKECGMGERQTKHTKTENRKKRKKKQNTPSKAEQLQCAFRFAAIPGLQAHGLQKSMFFNPCFYDDLGLIWGTLWGTILVKNR